MLDLIFTTTKNLQPIATEIIAIVAVIGFFNTRFLWTKSNRPIVSALIETHSSGNIAAFFNLTVINSGNRPAIDIKLAIDDWQEFQECINNKDHKIIEAIKRCFDEDSAIPILIDGDKTSNSFGAISKRKEDTVWIYGSSFSITISYKDLENKKYQSNLILFIKASEAFAGGSWKE